MSTQLTLFNDDSDQPISAGSKPLPVPLRAAKHFSFPLQYHEIDGEYWYSLNDWITGLTGETNKNKVSKIASKYKTETSTLSRTLEKLSYLGQDGKAYKRDFVSAYEAYRVAAYLRATDNRPALKRVKDYLAQAGAFVDQMQQDPRWAAARINGVISHNDFTAMLHDALHNPPRWVYGRATNEVYTGLFGRDAKQLSAELNTDKPRNKMTQPALAYLSIAEWKAARRLEGITEISISLALSIVREVADSIGEQIDDLELSTGIDIVTGKPLLNSGE